jgi:hypothetical protein
MSKFYIYCDIQAESQKYKQEEMSIARLWHGKNISAPMNNWATITGELLDAVFSMQSMPRLYNRD